MLSIRQENTWLDFEFICSIVIVSTYSIWEISLFIVKMIKLTVAQEYKTMATYYLKLYWAVLWSHVSSPNGLEYDGRSGGWKEASYLLMVSLWFRLVFLVFKCASFLIIVWMIDWSWKITGNFLWLRFGAAKRDPFPW